MSMRPVHSLFAALLFPAAVLAQPSNDSCTDAALLCHQQVLAGTTVNSMGGNGFCGTSHIVWYTLTTNSQGGPVNVRVSGVDCLTIPGMGDELRVVVLSGDGSCDLAQFTVVSNGCDNGGSDDFVVSTTPLAPHTTYWIMVGGVMGPGNTQHAQCDFHIAIDGPGADVPGVDFVMEPEGTVVIGLGESVQLTASGGTTYTWSPTSGLSGSTVPDPIASPEGTTVYQVSTTINDCTYDLWVTVIVVRRIEPPNTFTPNGDGVNDVWLIPGITDYPGAEVNVYDRWGQRVFRDVGYREPWDGTHNGKAVPTGTYYYDIRLNQLEGRSAPYTGFISIVR